jgi:hypothetical protein
LAQKGRRTHTKFIIAKPEGKTPVQRNIVMKVTEMQAEGMSWIKLSQEYLLDIINVPQEE